MQRAEKILPVKPLSVGGNYPQLVFQERPDSTLGTIAGDGKTTDFRMDLSAVETHPVVVVYTVYKAASFGN